MYAEVMANERLINAASDEVPNPNSAFVVRIHAFIDLPGSVDQYIFVHVSHAFSCISSESS